MLLSWSNMESASNHPAPRFSVPIGATCELGKVKTAFLCAQKAAYCGVTIWQFECLYD